MKKYLSIIVLFVLLSNNYASAQDASPFEGVWYPTKETYIEAINIKDIGDDKLLVQFKTSKGIEKHKVDIPTDNTITISVCYEESYGKWKLRGNMIMTASGGTYGEATTIYSRNSVANREKEYVSYRLELVDGNIQMQTRFSGDYLDSGNRVVFDQSSNWVNVAEFTNW